MKQRLTLFVVLMMALVVPQSMKAYDFSAVCSTGQVVYYNINGSDLSVTYPSSSSSSPYNGCTKPTGNLEIPSSVTYNGTTYSVTSIGYNAFSGCSGLTSVTIPSSVTSIDKSAFSNCSGLTSVAIPNSVTSIGVDAFLFCSGLTSVIIPNSVTIIGDWAFDGCSGLTSVTIPNSVTSIGKSVFAYCSGLTSVIIPNSVTNISNSAFSNCSSLTSVTIPNSVTSIGYQAFYDCSGLTSVIIPNSVTSIGNSAFQNVHHIKYYGSATGAPWGAISMNGVTDGDFVYSDSTKHKLIGYIGYGGNISIDSTVDSIGEKVFYNCSGLTSVTIPNSVISIGNSAFYHCSSLTSVFIPNSVICIGSYAFSIVHHIEYFGIATGAPWGALSMNGVTDGDFIYSDSTKHKLIGYYP